MMGLDTAQFGGVIAAGVVSGSGRAIVEGLPDEETARRESMKVPTDRKYAETHEWFLPEGDTVTMGITQYAADELTDITYIELPEVGKSVSAGDTLGEVESVKATSEIFTAVAGKIVAANDNLADHPELLNDDAFDEGWICKIEAANAEDLKGLMSAKEYTAFVRNSG